MIYPYDHHLSGGFLFTMNGYNYMGDHLINTGWLMISSPILLDDHGGSRTSDQLGILWTAKAS